MSRTRKGRKPAGFEFWSARPGNKHGNLMGKDAKRFTHRRERQEGRRSCRAVADAQEWRDPRFHFQEPLKLGRKFL